MFCPSFAVVACGNSQRNKMSGIHDGSAGLIVLNKEWGVKLLQCRQNSVFADILPFLQMQTDLPLIAEFIVLCTAQQHP